MSEYKDNELKIYERLILRFITTVLIVASVNMITSINDWTVLTYVESINTLGLVFLFLLTFASLSFYNHYSYKNNNKNLDAFFFVISILFFGFIIVLSEKNIYLAITIVFFSLMGILYILKRFPNSLKNFSLSKKQMKIALIFIAVTFVLYLGSLVVLRYFLFKCVTFDFGIFSQMYYSMKETGLPMTTCERDIYLSHFAVHFSPIFYIILPFYIIFPHPVTIIVLQLLVVVSGAIPIYLICRNKKMSNLITFGLVVIYLLYPTMSGGLFYDFHENKFLPAMLLWLIYFLDNNNVSKKRQNVGVVIFTLLSLMVKEDSAIYVACIGLFWLINKTERKEKARGAYIFIGSVVYFFIVFYCLGRFGQGTFIGRYDNFMVNTEDGLFGMVFNMIKNPAYVLKQLLTAEKLEFIFWTMAPVMFVPIMVKKMSMYILLIPYIVINLMTDYNYQYDIGFQYTYGSCTLLIYMTILWFEGKENNKKKRYIIGMLVSTFLLTTSSISEKNIYYTEIKSDYESNMEIFELLYSIPEEASVRATTTFVPPVSQRREVYRYQADIETDYVVFDMRSSSKREGYEKDINELLEGKYEKVEEIENQILIIKKKR